MKVKIRFYEHSIMLYSVNYKKLYKQTKHMMKIVLIIATYISCGKFILIKKASIIENKKTTRHQLKKIRKELKKYWKRKKPKNFDYVLINLVTSGICYIGKTTYMLDANPENIKYGKPTYVRTTYGKHQR